MTNRYKGSTVGGNLCPAEAYKRASRMPRPTRPSHSEGERHSSLGREAELLGAAVVGQVVAEPALPRGFDLGYRLRQRIATIRMGRHQGGDTQVDAFQVRVAAVLLAHQDPALGLQL